MGEVCKQLMSKLSFDEKEVKKKLIKIKEKLREVMDEYTELEKINCLTNAEDDNNLKIVQKAEREISSFFQNFLSC
jgi:F0F1-type ATP synthase beta subunit